MNEFLFALPAVTPSSEAEIALLEAHLGLYEDHVRAFEEYMMDREMSAWYAEMERQCEFDEPIAEMMQ